MLSEIQDGHSEAREIGRRSGPGCVRFSPAEFGRAKTEEGRVAQAGKNSSTTECEMRRAVLCVSPHPTSRPKLDRGRAVWDGIARCANRSECREHPRTAGL